MKKLLLALGVVSLLTVTAYASEPITGKIVKMEQWHADNAYFVEDDANPGCVMKAIASAVLGVDGRKTFNAIILTAMSTNKKVTIKFDALPVCNDSAPGNALGLILIND